MRAFYVCKLCPTVLSFQVPGPPIPTIPGTMRATSGANVFPGEEGEGLVGIDAVCVACGVLTIMHVFNADLFAFNPKLSTHDEYVMCPLPLSPFKRDTEEGADAPVPPDR